MSWVIEVNERKQLLSERAARLSDPNVRVRVNDLLNSVPLTSNRFSWSGDNVEIAWQVLREAERVLLSAENDDEVAAVIPRLLARLHGLATQDVRRKLLQTPLRKIYDSWAQNRRLANGEKDAVLALYDEVYAASDDHHRDVRALRNVLLSSTLCLTAAVIVVSFIHLLDPSWISLCREGEAETTCLNGTKATGADLFQLALVGALGGLVGGVRTLSTSSRIRSRYNVRTAQIALKPALGAAMAILGVLLIQARIFVLTPDGDALLAYGALFGISQQLLTRLVDIKANALLGQARKKPEKKPESENTARAASENRVNAPTWITRFARGRQRTS